MLADLPLNWLSVALQVLVGGWMLVDGLRALRTGAYKTPNSGDYAGRLGPWAGLLHRLGIDPNSNLAKWAHVIVGLLWLATALGAVLGAAWYTSVAIAAAILGLWYLPFGTLVSLLTLAILYLMR